MPLVKGTSSVEDSRALSKALKQTKFPKHFSSKVQDWSKIQRAVITNWIEKQITASLGFEDEIVSNTAVNLFLPPEDNNNTQTTTDINPRTAQIDLAGFLGDEDAAKFASELWEMLLDASQQPTGIPRKILDAKMKEYAIQQEQQKLLAQEKERKRQIHRTDGKPADNVGIVDKRSRWGDKTRNDSIETQTNNQRNATINYPHAMYSESRLNSNAARAAEIRRYNDNSDHRRPDRIIANKYDHQRSDRNAAFSAEHRRDDRMHQSRRVDYDSENGAKNQTGDQNKATQSANDTSYSSTYKSSSNDRRTENNDDKRRGNTGSIGVNRDSESTISRTEEYEYDTFGRRVRSLPQGVSGSANAFSHHRHREGKVDEMPRHGNNHSDRFDNNYRNFNSRDRYHPTNQRHPQSQYQYDDRGREWRRRRPPSPRRDDIVNRRGDNNSPSSTTNREIPVKREVRRSRSRSQSRSRSPSYSSHSRSASNSYSSTSSRGRTRRRDRSNRSRSSSSSVSSRTSASSSSSFSTRGSNDK